MKTINMDIMDVQNGVIIHQVNCQGVMEAGLAQQIAQKWPEVEFKYKTYCRELGRDKGKEILGKSILVRVCAAAPNILYVGNVFGQQFYSKGQKHTDYTALSNGLKGLATTLDKFKDLQIYIPFKMGCGLGGGDWNVVEPIIEDIFPHAIICCNY